MMRRWVIFISVRAWGRRPGLLDVLADGSDGGQLELTDRVSKVLDTEELHREVIFPYGCKYSLFGAFCAVRLSSPTSAYEPGYHW